MEGDRSRNPDSVAVIAAEGQPAPSNEAPANAPSTEAAVDPEPPYTPLDVWVKEVKYSDKSQREYDPMQISEKDRHASKFALSHNVELSVRALMKLFFIRQYNPDDQEAYKSIRKGKGRQLQGCE